MSQVRTTCTLARSRREESDRPAVAAIGALLVDGATFNFCFHRKESEGKGRSSTIHRHGASKARTAEVIAGWARAMTDNGDIGRTSMQHV